MINNGEIIRDLGEELQLDNQSPPSNINPSIVPVYSINKKFSTICSAYGKTTTGSGTIYTTPLKKDFYITGILLGVRQDAACDQTGVTVQATIGGANTIIFFVQMVPSAAGTLQNSMSLPFPIKIDRGTNITLVPSFTAGTQSSRVSIFGFLL